jgi:Tfp pilus assembly protein PilO
MTETTKQNFSILLITLLIAGTIFLFASFIKPSFNTTKELSLKIKETKESIKLLQEYKLKSESLIQIYLDLGDQVDDINLALPDDAQTAQILATLDMISKNTGISLSTLTFREITKDEQDQLEIKIKFSSSYENFKKWIEEIEKELRIIDFTKSNIQAMNLSKSKTSNILEYDITLVTYFLSYGD